MIDYKMDEHILSRIEWIDIAKALGVVLVVLGHTGLPEVFRRWVYIFHMPLFFYISGMFFKPVTLDVAIKKKGKAYLLPYILFSAVFMAMNQLVDFGPQRLLNDMRRIITLRGTFPVLWFLTGLFFVEVIYTAAYQSITKNKEKLVWLSCFAGFCASIANLGGGVENYLIWQSICEGLVFFAAGVYRGKPNKTEMHISTEKCIVELVLTVLYAVAFQKIEIGVVDISQGQMGIPGLNIVMALITRAKQLLRFTDMTVDEVGAAVGMGDANYFSRMFRKVEGISPREYRKQW